MEVLLISVSVQVEVELDLCRLVELAQHLARVPVAVDVSCVEGATVRELIVESGRVKHDSVILRFH